MLGILFLGLLFIWVYKFSQKHQLNPTPWFVFIILGYPAGYYGFVYFASIFFRQLIDNEWELLVYPLISGSVIVGIVIFFMKQSGRQDKRKTKDEDLLD